MESLTFSTGLGLGRVLVGLSCVFSGDLSRARPEGVWKALAFALVVFWPRGARVRGPLNISRDSGLWRRIAYPSESQRHSYRT